MRGLRVVGGGTVAVLVISAAAFVADAGSAQAAPVNPPGNVYPGAYVAAPSPVRVLDTRAKFHGVKKGAVKAGKSVKVRVTGYGSVPRRGVAAVVVSLRAIKPSASGGLVAYGLRRPAGTSNLQFRKGADTTATAVVPVTSAGRIVVQNQARRGTVQIAADVLGYYRGGRASGADHGVFHALPVARRVFAVHTVRAGGVVSPTFGGRAGIPADAGAVAATVSVVGPARTGAIAAWRQGDPASSLPAVRFRSKQSTAAFAVLGVGSGRTNLRNLSSGPVRIAVDVVGYYTEGVAQTAGMLRPVPATRIASHNVGRGGRFNVTVAGRGGVPISRVSAVVVTLDVTGRRGSGSVQVARYGAKRPGKTAAVTFSRGVTNATTVVVPVANGRFSLWNDSKKAVRVDVDVRGYVPADTVRPPATSAARYPNGLNGDTTHDQQVLRADGAADARRRSPFVLLDLGAQSTKAPTLSPQHPGIVLALTGSARVAITYEDLVADLSAYLTGYAQTAPGYRPTIAVGTNNDGAFDPKDPNYYSPADRGRDFADKVIDPLRAAAPAGINVVGANDIEAGFASTFGQAYQWEVSYLDATPAGLIYNGSLDGCPAVFGSGAACAHGWTQPGYVALTSNRGRVQVLPQVYVRNQSVQWANVDRTARGRLRYVGVLTETYDRGTFTAPQGWTAFVRAQASVRATPPTVGLLSVDIRPDR